MTSPRAAHEDVTSFIEPVAPSAAEYPTRAHAVDPSTQALPADYRESDDGFVGLPSGRTTDDREPTEAEVEEAADVVESGLQASRSKADRATRGVLSALLALEALVVLLVPRAIAQTATGLDTTKTVILVALAVVLMITAFVMRRRWAVGLGSALQLGVFATGVLEWVMFVVALVFMGLWIWVLTMRRDWVRTPGGLRMLVS